MNLFSDYIQPLTLWLDSHPYWALFITFLVSFSESLAIIGSIIPGSVTMTAIGILAGSGVMRIDLTLLAAILGAIAGDGASYLLGYSFSERIANIWPFSRYPSWLAYGKDYFSKHGGKSVLIGRFVGPLRSIIPVIAGMMHMSHWRFFIANAISAVAWALLYVLPGVIIGTASSELSPESATRFLILILLLLVAIWLLSMGLKWLFIQLNRVLRANLHDFWSWSQNHPHLAKIVERLTPADEDNHYPTAALVILLILSTFLFCLITGFIIHQGSWLVNLNQSIHLFLQSLRTHSFDIFFIAVSQLISPPALLSIIAAIIGLCLYYKDWRTLAYCLSLNLCCAVVLLLMHLSIDIPRPEGILNSKTSSAYPLFELTYASALFTAFMLYLNTYYKDSFSRILKVVLSTSLLLTGLAPIYLGDNWLTDSLGAYFCGISIALGHWLLYRRHKPKLPHNTWAPIIVLLTLLIASSFSYLIIHKKSIHSHQPYFAQYVFSDELWWNQTEPLLPIYSTNRIGRRLSLFNIQYAGSLNRFAAALENFGWQRQDYSLLNSILTRVGGQPFPELPLMAQLYLNRKPVLLMTYQPADGSPMQVLRIWRSNYHLLHLRQPIWLGSVHTRQLTKKEEHIQEVFAETKTESLSYVSQALVDFKQRKTPLPLQVSAEQLPIEVEPVLLLIKESPELEDD